MATTLGSLALAAVTAARETHELRQPAARATWQPPAAMREYAVALAWVAGVAVIRTGLHDVVNNSLNQLQILRFDAEGHVPSTSIAMFDKTILETVDRLRALENMTTYAEKPMAIGTGLDDTPI